MRQQIDTLMMVKYCGASDDYAPVHWNHPMMVDQGFPGVVVQGWLTFAYMTQAVTNWIPLEVADVAKYAVRYRKPSFPGAMTVGGVVLDRRKEDGKKLVDLELWAKDADGAVTTTATMTLVSA